MSGIRAMDALEMVERGARHRAPSWRQILIATDGTSGCDGAITLARELALRTGAALSAVTVDDTPRMMRDSSAPAFDVLTESSEGAERARRVQGQLRTLLGEIDCPLAVRRGTVCDEVAKHATALGADLLVLGRVRRDGLTRLKGDDHLLPLLRAAACPVLAVNSGGELPRSIVVGVDFGPDSSELVEAAAQLAGDRSRLYLLHVKPDPPFGLPHPGRWLESYEAGVRVGLEGLARGLDLPPTCAVEALVVHGQPGETLVNFAQLTNADVIAVGRRGAGFLDRLLVGSVTTRLTRAADRSLFVVPGAHR